MEQKIYLAPLQGFTDFVYRKAWWKVFDGADAYFVPYLTAKNNEILKKHKREILPDNNPQERVVPQALAKNHTELLDIASWVEEYNYTELNLNLGCPYPMVSKAGRGAGLLTNPEKIKRMLSEFYANSNLKLSVKLRAGWLAPQELELVLPVLNQFPLKEIILHPRVAKQLYKGEIFDEAFVFAKKYAKHPLVFNGDIFTKDDFGLRKKQFPECNTWMLGRGILMNPFLPMEINELELTSGQRYTKLIEFHALILEDYMERMDNEGNALNKMQQFWIYFSHTFPNQKKVLKVVKKAKNMKKYREETRRIFDY